MYKILVSPILDRMDSESWHDNARKALHYAERSPLSLSVLERTTRTRGRLIDDRLRVSFRGMDFDNPVMVGAGWDKAGTSVKALYALGFSGVEVGSVVERPQVGNPKPRQFMVAPGVAINSLGFNSPGAYAVANNLNAYLDSGIPIGISLGKNKDTPPEKASEAHATVTRALYRYASYFAINVSSPNTPGLRKLQDRGPLSEIVQAVIAAMNEMGGRKPLLVKIAPELTNEAVDDVIRVAVDNNLTGIIATNTVAEPEVKARYGERWRQVPGGLSGDDPVYRKMATDKVAYIHKATGGRMHVIGVGGVKNAATALEKIRAGASLVQVVTAIRGEGPTVAVRINQGIALWMRQNGVRTLDEIVGMDSD